MESKGNAESPGRGYGAPSGPGVFVTGSAWIALMSARDEHHAEADTVLRRLVQEKRTLVTTNLVIAETHRLLVHRAGLGPGRLFLERLDTSPVLKVRFCTRAHHDQARDWLDRLESRPLTYTDAASFAVMAAEGIRQVVGFDPAFDWAGFTRIGA